MEQIMNSYHDHKDAVLKRLTRAEGQIRGISRMVAEDKYCIDVITQISAAQAALDKIALELLRDHAKGCMAAGSNPERLEKQTDELIGAVDRLMSR
jgi:DNA-binding FrmR family transcriptional regulator